ncbi:lycopene beta-cyclase CrtY [Sphingomonas sp. GCM10030256]|uniref:lycopene beta-cyclase CrtY n=1 Tax=Sphingomonas sp. GCM10030256 TaxID=3273427 RepID=UPI00361686A7
MPSPRFDLLILGGGLAGGLCALALRQRRPDLRVGLVEPGERIGGNHLWSFFESDIAASDRPLIEPLVSHRWPAYGVTFPDYQRRIAEPYRTIESESLDRVVRTTLPLECIVRASAVSATATSATLDSGEALTALAVLDCRGGKAEGLTCGWQKFAGQLLEVRRGHGLREPIVMDATVDQADGYRFIYALPFDADHVFVEDTYYSDTPDLDPASLQERIAAYSSAQGWTVGLVSREEFGQLPVVTGGDFERFWPVGDPVARAGVRGGFFHPLTSYSLPEAVRFASWLANEAPLDDLAAETRRRAQRHWRNSTFDRLLARMLFRAADPPERYRVLQRFYRLPAPLIARFYSGRSTMADRVRILAGRPPVSVTRAFRVMLERV